MKVVFKPLYYKVTHEWTLLACYLFLVPITVFAMIQFINSDFSNGIFGTSFIFAIICLIILLLSIGYGGALVSKNKQKLYEPVYQYQNGFLYSPFNQKNPQMLTFILSTVIFFIMALIIGINFETSSYKTGIWCLFIFSLVHLILIIALFPFKIKLINIFEICSSIFLMLAFMFLLISIYYIDDVRTCSKHGYFFDIMFLICALLFIVSVLAAAIIYFLKYNNSNKQVVYQDNSSFEAFRIKFNKVGEIDTENLLIMKNGMYTATNVDKKNDITSKEQLLSGNKNTMNVNGTTNIQRIADNQNDKTEEIDKNKNIKMQSSLNKQEIILNNESRKFRNNQNITNQQNIFKPGSFENEEQFKDIPEFKSQEDHNNINTNQIQPKFGDGFNNLKENYIPNPDRNEKTYRLQQDPNESREAYLNRFQPDSEDDQYLNYQASFYRNQSNMNNQNTKTRFQTQNGNSEFNRNVVYDHGKYNPNMHQSSLKNIIMTPTEDLYRQKESQQKGSFEKELEDNEYDLIKQKVMESKSDFENRDSYPLIQSQNNSSYIGHQYNINNAPEQYFQGRLTNKYQEENYSNASSISDFDQNIRNSHQVTRKKNKINFEENEGYHFNPNYQINQYRH